MSKKNNKKLKKNKDVKKEKVIVEQSVKENIPKVNKPIYEDIEFIDPIEIKEEDIEGYIKNTFSLSKELKHIKEDLKNNKGKNLILIWLSLVLLMIGIGLFTGYFITKNGGVEVDAIICDVVETTTGDGKHVDYYEAKLMYSYKQKIYEDVVYKDANESMMIGDAVKVRINPNNPKKIYSNKGYFNYGIIALAASVLMCIGHFYMAWRKIYVADQQE